MKVISHLHSAMHGKVCGLIYSTRPTGIISARQFTAPSNPNTKAQAWVRSTLSELVIKWRNFTDEQRNEWANWLATLPGGGTYMAQFIGEASRITLMHTMGEMTTAPTYAPLDLTKYICPSFMTGPPSTGAGFSIVINNDIGTDFCYSLAHVSPPTLPTRYKWFGPWIAADYRFHKSPAGTHTGLIEWTNLVLGNLYFVRLRFTGEKAPFIGNGDTKFRLVALPSTP